MNDPTCSAITIPNGIEIPDEVGEEAEPSPDGSSTLWIGRATGEALAARGARVIVQTPGGGGWGQTQWSAFTGSAGSLRKTFWT